MLIKVLVAEDELPLLRGIKVMVERLNSNFEVIMCAKNGKEAIDFLKSNNVDVVFTDINMPLVDGLEVLDYVGKNMPQTQSVVISGYNEFSYAKEALKSGAKNYILKPIDQQELVVLLEQLEHEVERRKYEFQKNVLKDVIYSAKGSNNKFSDVERIYIAVFCVGCYQDGDSEELIPGSEFWENRNLEEETMRLLPGKQNIWWFTKYQMNERILLITSKEDFSMKSFIANYVHTFNRNQTLLTAAYIERSVAMKEIPHACRGLRRKIRDNLVFGKSSIINEKSNLNCLNLNLAQKETLHYISKNGKTNELEKFFNEILGYLNSYSFTQKELESYLEKIFYHLNTNEISEAEEIQEIVRNVISYSKDVEQLITNSLIVARDFLNTVEPADNELLMKKIDDYILKNINLPLSTKMLSAEFGLVAPYLSKLFKDYKGLTPSQYIQKLRLDSAKSLLSKCPDLLAKDIAEILGYASPLYFSKAFKKNVGMYPSEYRKIHKKE